MINVSNLSFEYDGKTVLHDISFNIEENSIVALVGPNGAGKTTLLRCLAALHTASSGNVSINNFDCVESPRSVHRCTGYLSDFFGLYDALTVRQSLLHMARCQNIPKNEIKSRIDEVANDTGLTNYLDKRAGALSRGYRQRLGVGLAIIHKPKVLLLDEPASGMDPEARIRLSDLMLMLKSQGMTVIVSSHILAELEDYCSDMLVLRDGKLCDYVSNGSAKVVDSVDVSIKTLSIDESYLNIITAQDDISNVRVVDNRIIFSYLGGEDGLSELLKTLVMNDIPIINFEVKNKSLQNIYMSLADKNNKMNTQKTEGKS